MTLGRVYAAALAAGLACSSPEATTSAAREAALPPGTVAQVGASEIAVATVAAVASAQGIAPRAALERVLADASFALGSRAASPTFVAASLERAALARSLLERLAERARQAGPPTADELHEIVRERWVELDRPEAVRVAHVVVIKSDTARAAAARRLAEKLLATVEPALSDDDFIALARAVPADGFDVRAERLPPVTADGRTFERQGDGFVALPSSFDPSFARAANGLERPGQLSQVVESTFGFHVIRLQARLPAHTVAPAELGQLLAAEALARRAAGLRRELLEQLRGGSSVELSRSADELTARVRVAP